MKNKIFTITLINVKSRKNIKDFYIRTGHYYIIVKLRITIGHKYKITRTAMEKCEIKHCISMF